MALNPDDWQGKTLLQSVDAALEEMSEYLSPADLGVIQAIRSTAKFIDDAEAEGQMGKAAYAVAHVYSGLERLGGSVASRKELGITAKKTKANPLAVIRGGRDGAEESETG